MKWISGDLLHRPRHPDNQGAVWSLKERERICDYMTCTQNKQCLLYSQMFKNCVCMNQWCARVRERLHSLWCSWIINDEIRHNQQLRFIRLANRKNDRDLLHDASLGELRGNLLRSRKVRNCDSPKKSKRDICVVPFIKYYESQVHVWMRTVKNE